ncbi:hypothetical protein ASG90_04280 [Nocardioides sp. Soil797]|nr:hypothetical protein ASG90_04280 [Nocardioides sp. Soil797]
MHDLGSATAALATLVKHIDDSQLAAPTPCSAYALGDLLDHVDGLALAFTVAARKESSGEGPPPPGDASRLAQDWRTRIPRRLEELATAWRDPAAWEGTTAAGGVEMDGATTALVATNEVVVHGWDIARASGQEFEPGDESVAAARAFVEMFSGPGTEAMRGEIFGPEVAAAEGATAMEQLVAMTGRDPRWTA